MPITKDEVIRVANLARLNLSDASLTRLATQIDNILDYMKILNDVDTTGVSPTSHAISMTNVFREDKEPETFGKNKALENAPEKDEDSFMVPKVVG